MKCPVCGMENPAEATLCTQCGSALARPADVPPGPPPPPLPTGWTMGPGQPAAQQPAAGTQSWQQPSWQQQPAPAVPPIDLPNATTYIVISVLVLFFCCQPLGIVSLIFSILGSVATSSHDYEKARGHLKVAWWCNAIGIGAGVIGCIGFILFYGLVGIATVAGS